MSEVSPYMHINLMYFTDGVVNFWGNSGLMSKHNWLPVELKIILDSVLIFCVNTFQIC